MWTLLVGNLKLLLESHYLKTNSKRLLDRCSIEARLYAEDPYENFFPAPGPVYAFKPHYGEDIRWEIGLDSSDEISASFDPMIAKLVVSSSSRQRALEKLSAVLNQTLFSGPPANLEFLAYMCRHPEFLSGKLSTFFLDRHLDELSLIHI